MSLKSKPEINATMMLKADAAKTTRFPNSFIITKKVVKHGKYKVVKIIKTTTCFQVKGSCSREETPIAWAAMTIINSFLKKPKTKVEPNLSGKPKTKCTIGEKA